MNVASSAGSRPRVGIERKNPSRVIQAAVDGVSDVGVDQPSVDLLNEVGDLEESPLKASR